MGFVRFVREHLLASFLIVLGALATVYGILNDAYDAYQLGLPGWVWQIVGVLVIISALVVFMYRAHSGLPVAVPTLPEPPPAPESAPHPVDLDDLIRRTLQDAGQARAGTRRGRAAELALAEVSAVLLTLRKEKGIRFPKATGRADIDLETGCRILEGVGPFLRQGHEDEARRFAEEFSERLDSHS